MAVGLLPDDPLHQRQGILHPLRVEALRPEVGVRQADEQGVPLEDPNQLEIIMPITIKRAFLALTLFLVTACESQAAPFLVSDPVPNTATQPSHCQLTMDSVAGQDVEVVVNADGSVNCKFDLASLAYGSHTATAKHVLSDVWGRIESASSAPYTFTKTNPSTVTLSAPKGWRIVK